MHFVEIPPGKSNHGHGHQNEAVFYILQGKGYEIHDDKRYDWEQGDVAVVHTDSVHRHFNDGEETAKCLVVKAKSTWMYFNLIQQGRSGPVEGEERGMRNRSRSVTARWTQSSRRRRSTGSPRTSRSPRSHVSCDRAARS